MSYGSALDLGVQATSIHPLSPRRAPATPALPALAVPPILAVLALLALSAPLAQLTAAPLAAQTLQGSHESLLRQNLVAQQHDYTYLRTPNDVLQAVGSGELVEVQGNADLELAGDEVSFPYARPEVRIFLQQLARDYHAACGEPLVVTSLTRPITHQPWNASPLSVHPTGMAVDLRRSDRRVCRQWIESTLLALEGEGMIEAIRERWPAHYHLAVFPDPLLLPGPIGDPNGVTRLAALHRKSFGTLRESDTEPIGSYGRVHLTRSARTGRLRITQTGHAAVARHTTARGGRISLRRIAVARHRPTAHSTRSPLAGGSAARHRGNRSHAARSAASTATAR